VLEQFTTKQALITSGYYKNKDWNEYHISAQGNRLEHRLNGVKTIELIDLDEKGPGAGRHPRAANPRGRADGS
jgi:hypothetical protein